MKRKCVEIFRKNGRLHLQPVQLYTLLSVQLYTLLFRCLFVPLLSAALISSAITVYSQLLFTLRLQYTVYTVHLRSRHANCCRTFQF